MEHSIRIAAIIMIVGIADASGGSLTLDQVYHIPPPSPLHAVATHISRAQTFQAGIAGLLAQIDLQIGRDSGLTGTLTLEIRNTDAITGLPNPVNSESLYEVDLSISDLPVIDSTHVDIPFTTVDISAANISVAVGDRLAISLRRDGPYPPGALWRAAFSFAPDYAYGATYSRTNQTDDWERATLYNDAGFRTWVIPEPCSLALMVMGLAVIARRRRFSMQN